MLLQWYLGNLTALAAAAGLPQDKVHVHLGGSDTLVPHQPPNTPLTGGVVAHSQLGISVYRFPPDLVGSLDTTLAAAGRTTWAAVEWGLGDFWSGEHPHGSEAGWAEAFARTLGFRNCSMLAYYNWETMPANGLAAARALFHAYA